MDENTTPAKVRGPKKSHSTSLVSPLGKEGPKLRVTAKQQKDGSFRVFAAHIEKGRDGKPVTKIGASSTHATTEVAKRAVDEMIAAVIAKGWTLKQTGLAKPDAFDLANIPRAPKAAVPPSNFKR
jgi:hypothetical protein